MKRGFLSTKRVTKHVTGSDENPCFSFVLLVYNESFSRSFILVEERNLIRIVHIKNSFFGTISHPRSN